MNERLRRVPLTRVIEEVKELLKKKHTLSGAYYAVKERYPEETLPPVQEVAAELSGRRQKTLSAKWTKPALKEVATRSWNDELRGHLAKLGHEVNDAAGLERLLKRGRLVLLGRVQLSGKTRGLTTRQDEFRQELRGLSRSSDFSRLHQQLLNERELTFAAPTLLRTGDSYRCLEGAERVWVAWFSQLPVRFWVVDVEDRSPKQAELF